jgi:hypothetical protein
MLVGRKDDDGLRWKLFKALALVRDFKPFKPWRRLQKFHEFVGHFKTS